VDTGKITKVITLGFNRDKATFLNGGRPPEGAFFKWAMVSNCYCITYHPYVLVVNKTGSVIIFDTEKRTFRTVEVVPANERHSNPGALVNKDSPIYWVGPLEDGKMLFCCTAISPKAGKPSETVRLYLFRTLDIKTGKVELHGTDYSGLKDVKEGPFIEANGKVMTTEDFLSGKGFAHTPAEWPPIKR
jgi:hypothetical protein